MGSTLKGKNLLLFPLRVDLTENGGKLVDLLPLQVYPLTYIRDLVEAYLLHNAYM